MNLLRYVTTYLINNDGFKATEVVAWATIPRVGSTHEHIGAGATFEVSRAKIAPEVQVVNSLPRKLALKSFNSSTAFDEESVIVCKRPRIRLSTHGTNVSDVDIERLESILLEIRALTHAPLLHHKNIVDFLGIAWDREVAEYNPAELDSADPDHSPSCVPVLLLEHTRHGSLGDFAETEAYSLLSFEERSSLCRDIAEGLNALHKCGIVHGDVKPDNILVFDNHDGDESGMQFRLRAKLADFGFSVPERREETRFTLVGRTWPWNDPDWKVKELTWSQLQKTDVYSYGLVSWSILTKESLGNLFDVEFADVDMKDKDIRGHVEDVKDCHLAHNAANYFTGEDEPRKLLVELLFKFALERSMQSRREMVDIVNLWDTWFTGLG